MGERVRPHLGIIYYIIHTLYPYIHFHRRIMACSVVSALFLFQYKVCTFSE